MLKKTLKRSAKYSDESTMPELVSKDLEGKLDDIKPENASEEPNEDVFQAVLQFADNEGVNITDLEGYDLAVIADFCSNAIGKEVSVEEVEEVIETEKEDMASLEEQFEDGEEQAELPLEAGDVAENPEETPDENPDHLETDMSGEEGETFKDINEQTVVYLYRGFAEIGDNVRTFVEDEDNEERDPELVSTLEEFMEGYPEVMNVIKELAKKYVTSVELFDPEEGEEVNDTDVEETGDEEDDSDDVEDLEVVESYAKEHNLEHKAFESEFQIYAPFKSSEEADKFEAELSKFKGSEVFRHEDICEVHAFIRIK